MTVQKFYSNSPLVCKSLNQNLLAKAIQFDKVMHGVVYNIGRVLGMSYSVPDDCLTYTGKFRNVKEWIKGKVDINLDNEPKQDGWTKRKLTQVLASVFDPLGLISPFLVRSKFITQEVWKLKIDWDKVIPEAICLLWQIWLDQLTESCSLDRPQGQRKSYQLHTFCDASEEGVCEQSTFQSNQGLKSLPTCLQPNLESLPSRPNRSQGQKLLLASLPFDSAQLSEKLIQQLLKTLFLD
jgi:hypothetical protein